MIDLQETNMHVPERIGHVVETKERIVDMIENESGIA